MPNPPLAGADIAEMAPKDFSSCYNQDFLANWHRMFREFRKPIIAAVNGFAVPLATLLNP